MTQHDELSDKLTNNTALKVTIVMWFTVLCTSSILSCVYSVINVVIYHSYDEVYEVSVSGLSVIISITYMPVLYHGIAMITNVVAKTYAKIRYPGYQGRRSFIAY